MLLAAATLFLAASGSPGRVVAIQEIPPALELVVIFSDRAVSNLYHGPTCDLVKEVQGVAVISRSDAEARGFRPHECLTPKTPPAAAATTPERPTSRPAVAAVNVYVNPRARSYHRADCRKLVAKAVRVSLDRAARLRYWPCPACKPPLPPRREGGIVLFPRREKAIR